MGTIEVVYLKWPRDLHYSYEATVLGEDDFGVWMRCDEGGQVFKGGELAFTRPYALLSLVPHGPAWWSSLWYPPSEDDLEVYVDINTPPVWMSSTAVEMVDLDLDVEAKRDGTVEVLDRDEFEANQNALAYPADISARAERAVFDVTEMIRTGAEPFGSACHPWYRSCFPG